MSVVYPVGKVVIRARSPVSRSAETWGGTGPRVTRKGDRRTCVSPLAVGVLGLVLSAHCGVAPWARVSDSGNEYDQRQNTTAPMSRALRQNRAFDLPPSSARLVLTAQAGLDNGTQHALLAT